MKYIATLFLFTLGYASAASVGLASHPQGEEISINWQVVKNYLDTETESERFYTELTLTNHAGTPLEATGWHLYFTLSKLLLPESTPDSVQITRINGDLYRFQPTPAFTPIAPGESRTFRIDGMSTAVKECDLPSGHYFVFYDSLGKEEPPSAVTEVTVAPFISKQQTSRHPRDEVLVPTATSRFEENRQLTELPSGQVPLVLPTPIALQKRHGSVTLDASASISYTPGLENEARLLASHLSDFLGQTILSRKESESPGTIRLRTNTHHSYEAYTLITNSDLGTTIVGSDPAGVFYGTQTLLGLIPIEAWGEPQLLLKLPALQIMDAPRFPYRGLLIDVARNFQSKATVKKLIDLMAFYKLNRLHLHLSDDEGWRVEIKAIPELTTVGSRRGHTLDEQDCLMPSLGSGPDPTKTPGTGFYSQEDFVEILRYAADRHITVIPEFDFPGHARAAIIATESRRKRLMQAGQPEQANEFVLRDPNDKSEYLSAQFWNGNVVDIGLESTFHFLDTVVGEIANLYEQAGVPLQTFHMGGDEVPHGAWQKSPACQALVQSGKLASLEQAVLQDYFFLRMLEIMERRNLRMAGWEEMLLTPDENGGKQPNHDFLGKPVAGYVWNNVWGWGQEDYAYRLANAGFDIVLCNATSLYFDLAHDKHPQECGHSWAGYTDLKEPFEFAPYDYFQNANADIMGRSFAPDTFTDSVRLTQAGQAKILGIQCQLWGEYIRSSDRLEYMAFPRAIAVAERAWAEQPDWVTAEAPQQREKEFQTVWNQFVNTLGQRELPRLDFLHGGSNYRLPLPGAKIEEGKLHANIALPGLTIRYTTDGSEPSPSSTRYEQPVQVDGKVKLRAFDRQGRGSRTVDCEESKP